VFLDTDGSSKKTKTEYTSDIRHFLTWVQNQTNIQSHERLTHIDLITEISSPTIEEYKEHLSANFVPLSTINRRLSALRIFFRCSVAHGWIRENPASLVPNLKKPKIHEVLPPLHRDTLIAFSTFLSRSNLPKEHIETHIVNITEFLIWFEKGTVQRI
jgi:site-specific recombinase XerD